MLILGGGFGGIYTAKYLQKHCQNKFEVTLISDKNYFEFSPMLHEVATGGLYQNNVVESISTIAKKLEINFVKDYVTLINLQTRQVYTKNNNFSYDYLVMATGSKPRFFNIKGAKEYTIPLKTLAQAASIKESVLGAAFDSDQSHSKINYVVVGGGPTGLELTAELCDLVENELYTLSVKPKKSYKITLIVGEDKLTTFFSEKTQARVKKTLRDRGVKIIFGKRVSRVTKTGLVLSDDSKIDSNTIYWAAGVEPNIPETKGDLTKDNLGRIITNGHLQLKNYPEVFCVGDIVSGWPMLAYTATKQASITAQNIYLSFLGSSLKKFDFEPKVKLMSLGQKHAVGEFGSVSVHGFWVWFLWRTVYLFKILTTRKKLQIALNWTYNLFVGRDVSVVES